MSWVSSIGAALFAGLFCGAGSLWLSLNAMRWFEVSNFEGKAGFAAVGLTIIGAIVGVLIGLIASRIGVGFGLKAFPVQALCATGAAFVSLGAVAATTRAIADVPPKLRGRALVLDVELRFPSGLTERRDIAGNEASLELGVLSLERPVVRKRRSGEIFFDQARFEDGHWVVPGSADIFTARGRLILLVSTPTTNQGFLLPIRGRPRTEDTRWSEWLPTKRQPGSEESLSCRVRVRPQSD